MLARIYEELKQNTVHPYLVEEYPVTEKVMIGDCLDWMEANIWFSSDDSKKQVKELVTIMELWKSKRLPIDEQSDECVSYIFNLLPNEHLSLS